MRKREDKKNQDMEKEKRKWPRGEDRKKTEKVETLNRKGKGKKTKTKTRGTKKMHTFSQKPALLQTFNMVL